MDTRSVLGDNGVELHVSFLLDEALKKKSLLAACNARGLEHFEERDHFDGTVRILGATVSVHELIVEGYHSLANLQDHASNTP